MYKTREYHAHLTQNDEARNVGGTIMEIADQIEAALASGKPFSFRMMYDAITPYAQGNQDAIVFDMTNHDYLDGHVATDEFVRWIRRGNRPILDRPSDESMALIGRVRRLFRELDEDMTRGEKLAYWSAIDTMIAQIDADFLINPFTTGVMGPGEYYMGKLACFRIEVRLLLLGPDDADDRIDWKRTMDSASSYLYRFPS